MATLSDDGVLVLGTFSAASVPRAHLGPWPGPMGARDGLIIEIDTGPGVVITNPDDAEHAGEGALGQGELAERGAITGNKTSTGGLT